MHQKRNYSPQRLTVFLFVDATSRTTTHSLCYPASAHNFLYDVAPSIIETVFKITVPANVLWTFALQILAATHNLDLYPFLEAFAKLRKMTTSFDMSVGPSVRPSVRIEHTGSHKTDYHEI